MLRRISGARKRVLDVCVNDCVVYAGKYKNKLNVACGKCETTRTCKGVARKQYTFFPIKKQLEALMRDPLWSGALYPSVTEAKTDV